MNCPGLDDRWGTVGIAGGMIVNFWYVYPTVGLLFVMIAFASVAMGGFGSIKGAFFAGVIIGMIEMLFPMLGQVVGSDFLGPHFKFTVVYFAYFVIVVLRPQDCLDGNIKGRLRLQRFLKTRKGWLCYFNPFPCCLSLARGGILCQGGGDSVPPFSLFWDGVEYHWGLWGQVELGKAQYVGIGAYTVALTMVWWKIPFWVSMPIGIPLP